jgi:hypothetical protein
VNARQRFPTFREIVAPNPDSNSSEDPYIVNVRCEPSTLRLRSYRPVTCAATRFEGADDRARIGESRR